MLKGGNGFDGNSAKHVAHWTLFNIGAIRKRQSDKAWTILQEEQR
jgi:hypothetical protein